MDALREGHEEHGARRVAIGQVSVFGVAHHADDLVGAAGLGYVEAEVGADRVFAGLEEIMDEGLVDDGDVLGRKSVLFGDGTAADDWRAEGLGVSDTNVVPGGDYFSDVLTADVGHGLTLADDELAPVVLEWSVLRESGALDAGYVREAILQFAIHGIELGRCVRGVRRGEADDNAVVGLVAEVLVLQFHQASGEQSRAGEEHNGQRCLDNDEDFLRERGAVASAAIGSAKGFGGVGM